MPGMPVSGPTERREVRCTQRNVSAPLADAAWTDIHVVNMVASIETTLNIDDTVMDRLRCESARTGRTMSELVEMALRQFLQRRTAAPDLSPLPRFDSDGALMDVADREALYRVMEER